MEHETPLEYHKRIIYGKLVDKTLADKDYAELAPYAYGKEYSSDVARRLFYGSRRTLDLLEQEGLTSIANQDALAALEQRQRELQKERQRLCDQRREYNKLLAKDGRAEHLYEALAQSAEKLTDTIGTLYPSSHEEDFTFTDTEAVLVLSDWHYGMVTDNVFNQYDTEICKQSVQSIVKGATERLRLHGCKRLHIVVLGDLFHGAIHTSARVASEELVCDQLMQVAELLAQSVLELSHYVQETKVYFTYGNHCRTVQNKQDSIHRDNLERLIPWWLKERIKQHEAITVMEESSHEFIYFDLFGFGFCATHGDLDSVKQSTRLLPALFYQSYGKAVQYILLGDKHHRESFSELGVTAMLCGSLCGTDDYASSKRLFSEPSQLLLIVNPNCGVDAEYHLRCL